MIGILFEQFAEKLVPVPEEMDDDFPVKTFKVTDVVHAEGAAAIIEQFGEEFDFSREHDEYIPQLAKLLSFDHICKVKYSHQYGFKDEATEELFNTSSTPHMVFFRIFASLKTLWSGKTKWNDVVSLFNNLTKFDFERDDFVILLDHVRYWKPWGHSFYSDTFLDGSLAYNVHYKGKHVMTLGFSVIPGRRLLIRQIQMTQPKGNRFLFKLPDNLTEFVLERFHTAFPDHELYIADAEDLAKQSLARYQTSLNSYIYLIDHHELNGIDSRLEAEEVSIYRDYQVKMEQKMEALQNDIPRLQQVYGNLGTFKRGDTLLVRDLRHYRVEVG